MAPDDSRRRTPPPADESSAITATLIHGAPVVEAMSPPSTDDTRSGARPGVGALARPLAMPDFPVLLSQEIAFATDGFKALLQARTPLEFFTTQSRLVSGFYGRLIQRAFGGAARRAETRPGRPPA